ncbi:RheA repressor [Streptomyces sp. NBRC 110611]|uniref:hypothetical protein n=1 Tax=Streptomyces sp. NBRC 110611 TaxID=1621259 RepID=UPI000835D2F2|nr:hypothetical protein [Streptomyces sp. NBRC 110611]GAU67669.1 RheA repressor [Streptomyces sp. NBRC 110611]
MQQMTLAERAAVTYATVGRGARVHYSPSNDETLCGRLVGEYLDVIDASELLDEKGHKMCARCWQAAERRAEARRLAQQPEQDVVEVELAETVEAIEQADAAEGTWRGGWIPSTLAPADEVLFDVVPDVGQGALFG